MKPVGNSERLRKMLLYQKYITFCLERELGLLKEPAMSDERMLKWFEFAHLPPHLQAISEPFGTLASHVVAACDPGPERTVCLRKLLEAKDAGERAKLNPGG